VDATSTERDDLKRKRIDFSVAEATVKMKTLHAAAHRQQD
jgi:hypothetical protein